MNIARILILGICLTGILTLGAQGWEGVNEAKIKEYTKFACYHRHVARIMCETIYGFSYKEALTEQHVFELRNCKNRFIDRFEKNPKEVPCE